ncbi:Transducin beta-like protein 2 [Dionaea muscipula]
MMLDIIVLIRSLWWTHEKTSRGIDYYRKGNYVYPRLKVLKAYRKALTTWATWIDQYINPERTLVFFRGYSPTHFSGGQWNSGGQCHRETEPIFNESYLVSYPSKMRTLQHVLKQMKTPVIYLNVTRLTDYRKDGHPSIYRTIYETSEQRETAEQSQDCSHWCVPVFRILGMNCSMLISSSTKSDRDRDRTGPNQTMTPSNLAN